MKSKNNWNITPSRFSMDTINPIRSIVENLKVQPNPDKQMIPLSIGDPSTFGNLEACQEIRDCLIEAIDCKKFNGYLPSNGLQTAREAVAEYCSTDQDRISPNDVFITSGCSHALDLCISLLAEPGQNILIPRPGFPLYQTLASGYGIKTKFYNLIPEKNFSIDLEHLESVIDHNTAAIIYNNPSNPCGSVFNEEQVKQFLKIAKKNYLPVIADEIYENMVFPGEKFVSLGSFSKNVPILSCRGTTKRFLIPGHRLGWILFQDRGDAFGKSVRKGLQNLCQRILGANSIIQGALPEILKKTPQSFFDNTINIIYNNAETAYKRFLQIPGLIPIKPQGAMYMMISIDMPNFPKLKNDLEFVEKLVAEQSVFCLPGKCFDIENYIRVVITVPHDLLEQALSRIEEFCKKYYVPKVLITNENIDCKKDLVHSNQIIENRKQELINGFSKNKPIDKLNCLDMNSDIKKFDHLIDNMEKDEKLLELTNMIMRNSVSLIELRK